MELVNESTLAEYEGFIAAHPKGHFMQSPLWAKVKEAWTFEGLIVRGADGKIKGALSVLIRKVPVLRETLMYAPRGPVCDLDDEETFRALMADARELAKKHHSYVLKMDPDVSADHTEFIEMAKRCGFTLQNASKNFEGIQPRFVFRLYLEGRNADELMASFHQKTRYNIRVALKNGVTVEVADPSMLHTFHQIMLETGVRDGFVIRSEEYFKKLMEALGDHARLYMAYHEGKPIAGTLAIAYGDKVWYLYGASSNESRNVMPNYLLQFEMMKWAVELGCRIYDFRGVSGDLSPDNPLYGLYRFKKGFNGEFTEFVGEMNLVFKPFLNFAVTKGEKTFRTLRKNLFLLKNKK